MNRKKTFLSKEFIFTAILNILAIAVFLLVFDPLYQTNDDTTFAMFVEGAHGNCHGQLFYVNIIWGKFLSFLYSVIPTIKWYTALQMIGLFCSFFAITYIIYKKFTTVAATLINVFILAFFGYYSYVIFQFTKTASFSAIAGIVLIFYALESTENKHLRRFQILIGAGLTVFSSLIRFESMAMSALILSGIGVFKVVELLKGGFKENIKTVIKYVAVFGVTFAITIGGFAVNSYYYSMNDRIVNIMEFNTYRSELWDMGFPDYKENKELYKSLGISKKDYKYFQTWNMDTKKLNTEKMKALVEAKEKKTVDVKFVKDFIEDEGTVLGESFPFAVFMILAAIFLVADIKNLWLMLYQLAAVFGLNFYLYYVGRMGLERIDTGMWFACIVTQFCMLKSFDGKQDLKKLLSLVVAAASVVSVFEYPLDLKTSNPETRPFFELVSQDKEHFYACSVVLSTENSDLSGSYEFWDVAEKNSADNIYYLGGWNCYIPVSMNKLKNYGIKNVYKDCIDSSEIYIISTEEDIYSQFQSYVKRNYNKKAKLSLVKIIDGQLIWSVRTKAVDLSDKTIKKADSSIDYDYDIYIEKDGVSVDGHAFKKNVNSFNQRYYIKFKSKKDSKEKIYDLTCSKMKKNDDLMNGKYSHIYGRYYIDMEDFKDYEYSVILETGGEYYELPYEK